MTGTRRDGGAEARSEQSERGAGARTSDEEVSGAEGSGWPERESCPNQGVSGEDENWTGRRTEGLHTKCCASRSAHARRQQHACWLCSVERGRLSQKARRWPRGAPFLLGSFPSLTTMAALADIAISTAPSARAKCQQCKETIEKGPPPSRPRAPTRRRTPQSPCTMSA